MDVSILWNIFDGYLQLITRSVLVLMSDDLTLLNWKLNFQNDVYVSTIKYCAALCRLYSTGVLYLYCLQTQVDLNPLTPNDPYSGRTAPLTSKRCILYIYSTNIGSEYFKHGIYTPFFSLQNAVCFIIITYLVPVLFTFYIQVC